MKTLHRALAVLALVGGAFAVVAATPRLPLGEDEISAPELAHWLRERREGVQLVDLRADPAAEDGLPGAQQGGKGGGVTPGGIAVVYAERDVDRALLAAWRERSGRPAYRRLRGGLAAWQGEVLYPVLRAGASPLQRQQFSERAALSRYFGGTPRQLAPGEAPPPQRSRRGC